MEISKATIKSYKKHHKKFVKHLEENLIIDDIETNSNTDEVAALKLKIKQLIKDLIEEKEDHMNDLHQFNFLIKEIQGLSLRLDKVKFQIDVPLRKKKTNCEYNLKLKIHFHIYVSIMKQYFVHSA